MDGPVQAELASDRSNGTLSTIMAKDPVSKPLKLLHHEISGGRSKLQTESEPLRVAAHPPPEEGRKD